ncbi:MAG: hypothetical protein WC758_04240 [Candidatus Woesearchaeota archaeon]|jgi:hypothetical protein
MVDKLSNISRIREEDNLKKILSAHEIENFDYQRYANDLYVVFEDKHLLKFHSGLDSLRCTYILPEEYNLGLLPINLNASKETYQNLKNNITQYMYLGAFENIHNKEHVAAGIKFSAKWDLSQTKMILDECDITINNELLRSTKSNKTFLASFTRKFPNLSFMFNQAQYQYNKYITERTEEFALSAYPLIESRFIYERIRGFYQRSINEIENKLKKR